MPGLQRADFAAYVMWRYLRRRDRIIAGGADDFDRVVMETLGRLTGRIHSLLITSDWRPGAVQA